MLHEVIDLQRGWAGTSRTVAEAARLVNESLVDPVVVTTAQNIVRYLPERDKWAEVKAISQWVRNHIRYTNESVETIKTPRLMIDEIRRYGKAVGDCDDHVILWAALHKAVGNPVRFRVISQRPDRVANHIYGEVYVGGRWVADDLIVKHQPLGWRIPGAEVTADAVYGLSGTEERMEMIRAMRAVGGGVQMSPDAMLSLYTRAGNDYFGVAQKAARRFRVARGRGGPRTDSLEGVGFLPALASVAAAVKPLVSSLRKKKKSTSAPAPAPAPAPVPQKSGMEQYLPYALVGGGLLLVLVLMR